MLKIEKTVVDLKKTVGKNYKEFWDFKGRYRVVKGGRGSKKSTTAALWYIYHLLKHKNANLLCVRQFYNSLKDSQFSELKKACERLKVSHLFDFKISPLEITVKETGQKILFRGFDNPDSITSITVSHGYLCWVWIEEAYQVANEEEFNKLDFSIRGINDESLFPQITLTLNPWSEMWIKKRFFDKKDKNILAITRNYYHNEFLSEEDKKMFEDLKKNDYNSYKIVGEGEWGLSKGGYFNEFSYNLHTVPDMEIDFREDYDFYASFDYGLDMFAAYFYRVDRFLNVYVYREIYKEDIIVSKAAQELAKYIKEENIRCVYAPFDMWNRQRESGRSIADIFLSYGIPLVKSPKGRVSGWLSVKEFLKPVTQDGKLTSRLKIARSCVNLINSLPKLTRDENNLSDVSRFPHDITHAPDALRYFLGNIFSPPEIYEKNLMPYEGYNFTNSKKEEELFIDESLIDSFYD